MLLVGVLLLCVVRLSVCAAKKKTSYPSNVFACSLLFRRVVHAIAAALPHGVTFPAKPPAVQ
uniref:Secreted protein n=1 Tax=Anopheles quadriannulatus TaxID=34691 RepID=A0A182XS78_ANOQN